MTVKQSQDKILTNLIFLSFLILFFYTIFSYIFHDKNKKILLAEADIQTQRLFHYEIQEQGLFFRSILDSMLTNPSLSQAMLANDIKAIKQQINPIFEQLNQSNGVVYLNFISANRKQKVHFEGRQKIGYVIDRIDLFEEAETGVIADVLDLDMSGLATLRILVPWRDTNDNLIGFAELGFNLEPLINSIHSILGLDLLVLVNKNMLSRDLWEEGEKISGQPLRGWDEFASSVAVIQTLQTVPMPIGLMIEDGSKSREVSLTIDENKKTYAFYKHPLDNVRQRSIGEIVILKDVTKINKRFQRSFIFLCSGLFISFVVLIMRTRHLLRSNNAKS